MANELAVMSLQDYQNACNEVRASLGTDEKIVSSKLANKILEACGAEHSKGYFLGYEDGKAAGGIGSTASVNLSGIGTYFSYIDETGTLRDGLEITSSVCNILAPSFLIARAASGQIANMNIGGNCRLLYNTFAMAVFYIEGDGHIEVYVTGSGGGGSAS